ncbi:uncharacterized protein LOC115924536 [Strongylocentrotus purpuratus]|uniref:Uncharacterized protein n=1 Tax=Strongylocentrotus purpuratus TaxID=7668 RepID=A0A7M7SZH0_STRPU|nr:uncharacterized protein LOC115924536 [Strongylocentrotus purpuratus]
MATTEVNITSVAGNPVYPGYPPQQTYVTPEAPRTYTQAVHTAQPPAVVVHTAPQTSGMIRQAPSQPVRDYTMFAVIVTLCFCLPFGIVGIVKASEAKTKQNSGDVEGARQAAKSAFTWSLAGLIFGVVATLVVIIYYAVIQ